MSHFTVTVRITGERVARHGGSRDEALKEMLAPYQENNMGDCPRQFLEFVDSEDEYLAEYDTESIEMVRCPDGVLRYRWDEVFRKPGTFGTGGGSHEVPTSPGYEVVQVAHKDRFATFETFVADWHGVKERDPEKGRYGYWDNPNKKWDWWVVGGRWRGHYPVKAGVAPVVGEAGAFDNESRGGSDVVTVDQIDMDAVAAKEREAFDKFKAERLRFIAGDKFDAFDGPRSRMLDTGLLRIEEDPQAVIPDGEVQVGAPWGERHPHHVGTVRAGWRDVAKVVTDEQLEKYRCVFNPLRTYAALDDDGWHEPGEMGWWGSTSHTPDTYLAFAEAFQESFIRKAGPDDLLVVVDCHI